MINIKSNSQKIKPGDTFIALRGISSDGHQYIDDAIQRGASKIVAEEGSYSVPTEIVPNTREYLKKYLDDNYHHIIDDITLIGITGTNGKTTTSFLIYQALNKLGCKCAYIGTIGFFLAQKVTSLPNTNCDLCDTYDMIVQAYEQGYKVVVLEVSSQGISYGRIETLRFDYTIFTNLTCEHLDYHKTMENYALAKQQLFKQQKKGCLGIVNADDGYSVYFKINNYVTFGFSNCDYKITDYHLSRQGVSFTINDKISLSSKLIGKYNIYNLLVTYIVLEKMKFNLEDIQKTFIKLIPPSGRIDIVKYKTNMIIIDYAHTPDAMSNLFSAIESIAYNHLYIVFGCTGDRDRTKRPIMTSLALNKANYTFITSDDLHNESFENIVDDMLKDNTKTNYTIIKDRYQAVLSAIKKLSENDLLLILGKGHEEYIIVKDQKIPYNDHQAVMKIIEIEQKIML